MKRFHFSRQVFRGRIYVHLLPFGTVLAFLFAAILCGCATSSAFQPASINDVRFLDRSKSIHDNDVRITAAVPTVEEAEKIFGANLAEKEIQPAWLKVENHSDGIFYLATTAVDPNYFSPNEATYAVGGDFDDAGKKALEYHFRTMAFRNPIPPNASVSGFIYTNLDEGEKIVQVELIGNRQSKSFAFFMQVPGIRVDYLKVDFETLYPDNAVVNLSLDELRGALEKVPCCTTNKDGTKAGDPINLVVVGEFEDITAAFARRSWVPAEETYTTAIWKTVKSFLFGSRYRYSPVSPLYAYGRSQDLARQKPRHDIHQRNHLRLWYSPMRCEGKPVFVGQISRDIGVRFTSKAWPPVTHKIDPDVDEARRSLAEDLFFSHTMYRIGLVKGVGAATPTSPRENLTGDPFFTDGFRQVVFLGHEPALPGQIEILEWEPDVAFRFREGE